jgi:enoyl-CoA hydratase
MTEPLVTRAIHGDDDAAVAVLTLNRPDQLNPLDQHTIQALIAAIDETVAERRARALVITGAGRAFSAGGDLKRYQDLYRDRSRFDQFLDDFATLCDRVEHGPLVSVAMINGACIAGGLELALACDLVTMADTAVVADGHLRFAQLPGAGSSQRLVRAIGASRAKAWILTARHFSAAEAAAAGLVCEVTPPDQLLARTLEIASGIAVQSPLAVDYAKRLIALTESLPLEEGLAAERRFVGDYATTSFDAMEGLRAFAERRAPHYRGA